MRLQSKAQDNLFVFRFQVKRAVFLLFTEINDDGNFYPMFQTSAFRRCTGHGPKTYSGSKPLTSILLLLFHNSPMLCSAILILHVFIFRGTKGAPGKSVNSSLP